MDDKWEHEGNLVKRLVFDFSRILVLSSGSTEAAVFACLQQFFFTLFAQSLPRPPPLLSLYNLLSSLIFVLYNLLQTCEQRYGSFFLFFFFFFFLRATILVSLRYSTNVLQEVSLLQRVCTLRSQHTRWLANASEPLVFRNFLRTCFSICW